MAPPVKELGQPPDVTALTVSKETDVESAQRCSRGLNVRSVPPDFREMDAKNVPRTTTEMTVVMIFLMYLLLLTL